MDIVPITIWREARNQGSAGMLAVAWVIHNRAQHGKLWPEDPEEVCLQPFQFSCWNDRDPQRAKYPGDVDREYTAAVRAWRDVESGASTDPTFGAVYYLNPAAVARNPFDGPLYTETVRIDAHTFYKDA